MVLGLSGAVKSTLVNEILGDVKAEECTTTCAAYKYEGEVGTRKTTITVIDTQHEDFMDFFFRPHNFNAVLLVIQEEKITPVISTIIEVYGALTVSIPEDNIGIVVTPGAKEHPYQQKQDKMKALQEIQKEVSKRSGKFIVKILASELFLPDEEVRNWLLTCFGSVSRFNGSSLRSVENLKRVFQTTVSTYEKNDVSKMLLVVQKEKETLEGRKAKLIVSAGVMGGTSVIADTCVAIDWEIKSLESQIDRLKKVAKLPSSAPANLKSSHDMVVRYEKAKNSLQTIEKMTILWLETKF